MNTLTSSSRERSTCYFMRDLKFFRGKGAYYSQRNSRIMCASLAAAAASRGKQFSMASKTTEITAANLEPLNKRDLERLCCRHGLRPYGLKSQLLTRHRAHRATLLSSDSTAPPASSSSMEPGLPAAIALSPHPPLSPAATSIPSAPHRSACAAAFSPE